MVGGGIQGASIAWDATLRGLRVALVERDDFGAATSANSLRIVHGGLRYLARGDLRRMRESVRERSTLLRIAPGLVEPLPVLVPTGPPGVPRRLSFAAALAANDLLTASRNRNLAPGRRIPASRILSPQETRRYCPALGRQQITGGALWHDAKLVHPEELTRSFVRSATALGAVAAHYCVVEDFTVVGDRIDTVSVRDRATGEPQSVRAREIVLAAGPWTEELAARALGRRPTGVRLPGHALGLNLVLGREVARGAMGIMSRRTAADDPVGGGRRYLFFSPHGPVTLLGTWYGVATEAGTPAALDQGTRMLLEEANRACPDLGLEPSDVVGRQWGRLPLKAGREPGRPDALADRPRLVGHAAHGVRNLLAVEGVKLTTARAVAENVVDQVVRSLGRSRLPCRTRDEVLLGAGLGPPARGTG